MLNYILVFKIKGDEWSLGWNVGLVYKFNENYCWGLVYYLVVDVKFKGEYLNVFLMVYNVFI